MAKHMIKNFDERIDKPINLNQKTNKSDISKSSKKSRREKRNKRTSILMLLFRLISLIIIVICMYQLVNWYIENKKNNKMLDDMLSNYTDSTKDIVVGEDKISALEIKFEDLLEKNPDTVGWLTVKGTRINYPVVHGKDNDYYLTHSFDKSYNSAGWIFANYLNKFDGKDKNIAIFGHNRRDGSMFCTLKDTLKKEWYSNPDNYYIIFETKNGTEVYRVFSNYQITAESYYITSEFKNDSEYQNFLDTITKRSVYNYGINPNVNNRIITLSTCANDNTYRVVLHAVKVN